jgi:hypothetical protein
MLKKISTSIALFTLFLATTTQALPIVQADAFTTGDKNAVLETSTGLLWMDFGITNGKSLVEVESELSTTYQGWRLATEAEVKHLATDLFSTLPGWNPDEYGTGWGGTSNYGGNFLADVFGIWGNSGADNYWYFDNDLVMQNRPVIWSQGRFRRDDGQVAELYFGEASDTGADIFDGTVTVWGEYITWPEDAAFHSLGTLLVKSSVPEPSSGLMFLLGVAGLLISKSRTIRQS